LQSNSDTEENTPNENAAYQTMVLIALSSQKSSFVVAVEPTVNVLHKLAQPDPTNIKFDGYASHTHPTTTTGTKDTSTNIQACLPCPSWGWTLLSGEKKLADLLLRYLR